LPVARHETLVHPARENAKNAKTRRSQLKKPCFRHILRLMRRGYLIFVTHYSMDDNGEFRVEYRPVAHYGALRKLNSNPGGT